jgi:hypothetical protein
MSTLESASLSFRGKPWKKAKQVLPGRQKFFQGDEKTSPPPKESGPPDGGDRGVIKYLASNPPKPLF